MVLVYHATPVRMEMCYFDIVIETELLLFGALQKVLFMAQQFVADRKVLSGCMSPLLLYTHYYFFLFLVLLPQFWLYVVHPVFISVQFFYITIHMFSQWTGSVNIQFSLAPIQFFHFSHLNSRLRHAVHIDVLRLHLAEPGEEFGSMGWRAQFGFVLPLLVLLAFCSAEMGCALLGIIIYYIMSFFISFSIYAALECNQVILVKVNLYCVSIKFLWDALKIWATCGLWVKTAQVTSWQTFNIFP